MVRFACIYLIGFSFVELLFYKFAYFVVLFHFTMVLSQCCHLYHYAFWLLISKFADFKFNMVISFPFNLPWNWWIFSTHRKCRFSLFLLARKRFRSIFLFSNDSNSFFSLSHAPLFEEIMENMKRKNSPHSKSIQNFVLLFFFSFKFLCTWHHVMFAPMLGICWLLNLQNWFRMRWIFHLTKTEWRTRRVFTCGFWIIKNEFYIFPHWPSTEVLFFDVDFYRFGWSLDNIPHIYLLVTR